MLKIKKFLYCNSNAWYTKDIMYNLINSILRKYVDSFNNEPIPALHIMDKYTMHKNENVIKELESKDREVQFIPNGMTGVQQPLDAAVNKPFKTHIKNSYIQYCCAKKSIERVSRDTLVIWVAETRWDDNMVNSLLIKNSFKVTGLSNNLDESENELFTGFKRLMKMNMKKMI